MNYYFSVTSFICLNIFLFGLGETVINNGEPCSPKVRFSITLFSKDNECNWMISQKSDRCFKNMDCLIQDRYENTEESGIFR